MIGLEKRLRQHVRTLIAYHEFGHALFHIPDGNFFRPEWGRIELEADIVSYCALLPQHLLYSHSASELARGLGYPLRLVETRFKLFDHFNL